MFTDKERQKLLDLIGEKEDSTNWGPSEPTEGELDTITLLAGIRDKLDPKRKHFEPVLYIYYFNDRDRDGGELYPEQTLHLRNFDPGNGEYSTGVGYADGSGRTYIISLKEMPT